jgi:conserved oligomeric Golgi complex subunit 6
LTTKDIRNNVDCRIFQINDEFLDICGAVCSDVEDLGKVIQDLEDQVYDMENALQKAVEDTRSILDLTQDLTQKSKDAEMHRGIAQNFLKRFTLSPKEVTVLSSISEPLNHGFFEALEHLQQIHRDCKILLVAENQRAGLEIMDSMNSYQESAYEILFKWTQGECRMLRNESPEISSDFRRAMHAFRLRPILFEYNIFISACIEEILTIRSTSLVKAFHTALSVGGAGGFPKPIEFHAHDTIRYTGDILAWVHQVCMGEKEMLESLFGLNSALDRRKPTVSLPDAFENIEGYNASVKELLQCLNRNTESICPILKVCL